MPTGKSEPVSIDDSKTFKKAIEIAWQKAAPIKKGSRTVSLSLFDLFEAMEAAS